MSRMQPSWGPGPWDDEPDREEWLDEVTGLPCLALRNPTMGFWCGYVAVPKGHSAYGKDIDQVPGSPTVHGGITYAAACQEGGRICHTGEPKDVWWLGFDCGHAWDAWPNSVMLQSVVDGACVYRTLGYVKRECASLAAQLLTRCPVA